MGINLNYRLTHDDIEFLVREYIDEGDRNPRGLAFGRALKVVGCFVRDYAGGHLQMRAAADILHTEISRIVDSRSLLEMTIGEFLSLYVDTQPGLIDFGKAKGLVPLDDRNERDNQYREDR